MNSYISPISSCNKCLNDFDTDELNDEMTCEKCLEKEKGKMKKYIVKQEASVLYQIEIEAENEDQALELGQKKLFDGEGSETPYTFEWTDWSSVEDYANNETGR